MRPFQLLDGGRRRRRQAVLVFLRRRRRPPRARAYLPKGPRRTARPVCGPRPGPTDIPATGAHAPSGSLRARGAEFMTGPRETHTRTHGPGARAQSTPLATTPRWDQTESRRKVRERIGTARACVRGARPPRVAARGKGRLAAGQSDGPPKTSRRRAAPPCPRLAARRKTPPPPWESVPPRPA